MTTPAQSLVADAVGRRYPSACSEHVRETQAPSSADGRTRFVGPEHDSPAFQSGASTPASTPSACTARNPHILAHAQDPTATAAALARAVAALRAAHRDLLTVERVYRMVTPTYGTGLLATRAREVRLRLWDAYREGGGGA